MLRIASLFKKIAKLILLSPVPKILISNSKNFYLRMPIPLRRLFDPLAKRIYFLIKNEIITIPQTFSKFTGSAWIPNIQPRLGSQRNYDLTIILPSLKPGTFTAGPGIAIQIAASVAMLGRHVRIVAIDGKNSNYIVPTSEIRKFLADTLQYKELPDNLAFEVLDDVLQISRNETFMATAWWTFRLATDSQKLGGHKSPTFYLIQDFEPLLHNSSGESVLAEETYSLPHIPIVASNILASFYIENAIGITAEQLLSPSNSFVIPLPRIPIHLVGQIDKIRSTGIIDCSKRNLLFYARPGVAARNLFEVGIFALQKSIEIGLLNPNEWNFIGVGAKFDDIKLSDNAILKCAPWLDYEMYLQLISRVDVYLALMNSPHTGFPVIEAIQLGVPAVTSTYDTKNLEKLSEISNGIHASEPQGAKIVENLSLAIANGANFNVNPEYFRDLGESYAELGSWIGDKLGEQILQEIDLEDTSYCLTCQQSKIMINPESTKLTVAVAIFNIDLVLLKKFLQSLAIAEANSHGNLQILILNNGSNLYENHRLKEFIIKFLPTAEYLAIETNDGIVAGMRTLLFHANGDYFIPMDADDLVAPNSFEVILKHVQVEPQIDFWYSNEWLLSGNSSDAAVRYEFDPVLLTEICYTTHLNIFKTDVAKELAIFEFAPNGSHDWFSAIQFLKANRTFKHLNHFMYFWRMHEKSTAANWTSKPYVKESQWQVLQNFADHIDKDKFEIRKHPQFVGAPNGRIYLKEDALNPEFLRVDYDVLGNVISPKIPNEMILQTSEKFIWLGIELGQITDLQRLEISTLISLWPNAVFTGPSVLANGYRIEPPEAETCISELASPHYLLKEYFRRTVQDFLPTNFLLPVEILQAVSWNFEWSLHKTIGAVRKYIKSNQTSIIMSPDLCSDTGEGLSLNQIHLLNDFSMLAENRVLVYIDNQRIEPEEFSSLEIHLSESEDLISSDIEIITTLRGTSNAVYLRELFHSLKDQLSQNATWRVLVHGQQRIDIANLLTQLSVEPNIAIIETSTSLSLEEALRKAISTSTSNWVFLVDYDDQIFPHTMNVLRNVIEQVPADVYVGNETVGNDICNALYFKRNIPHRLSLAMYSQFFHPIVSKRISLLSLLNNESNYVVDWQIVDNQEEPQKLAFIDTPLYFWRSHLASTTNKKEGSFESRKVVESRLLKLIEPLPKSLGLALSNQNLEPKIIKRAGVLPKICLQIIGRGSFEEKSNTMQRFQDKYQFGHYAFVKEATECGCNPDFILSLPVNVQPSNDFDLFNSLALLSINDNHLVGMVFDSRNVSSNVIIFSEKLRIFDNLQQQVPGESLFHKLEHLPLVKINSLSPSLISSKSLNLGLRKKYLGVLVNGLNVSYIDNWK